MVSLMGCVYLSIYNGLSKMEIISQPVVDSNMYKVHTKIPGTSEGFICRALFYHHRLCLVLLISQVVSCVVDVVAVVVVVLMSQCETVVTRQALKNCCLWLISFALKGRVSETRQITVSVSCRSTMINVSTST